MTLPLPDAQLPDAHLDATARLAAVQDEIHRAAQDAKRDAGEVTLIAVSKTQGPDAILPLIAAGQRVFGENRVQEAQGRWIPRRSESAKGLELRLIGPLQTNKVRDAFKVFDAIETLDRPKLALEIAREIQRAGRAPELFVQVNIGEERQKAGVSLADVDGYIRTCRDEFDLTIDGLMCIPPVGRQASPYFALLAKLARRNGLARLSMGMTSDFELAIQLGATEVRVGSAIFGGR